MKEYNVSDSVNKKRKKHLKKYLQNIKKPKSISQFTVLIIKMSTMTILKTLVSIRINLKNKL